MLRTMSPKTDRDLGFHAAMYGLIAEIFEEQSHDLVAVRKSF
jgi:hypothetical protein